MEERKEEEEDIPSTKEPVGLLWTDAKVWMAPR
jgi:hypothetical protein